MRIIERKSYLKSLQNVRLTPDEGGVFTLSKDGTVINYTPVKNI